ncbi:hypothetical protein F5Y17DRAFT_459537 [Xylariaceae sp. FL0594]|nr:hypothetical protein F5Y17DRAFT_459537 [Xylariaceae sp. FL0594]
MACADVIPENISRALFDQLLTRYDSLVSSISSEKAPKPGQQSLVELDDFRYNTATEAFKSAKPRRSMTHDDVKKLVEWKLRHGTYRPTLMNLVSSNDGSTVQATIKEATEKYWSDKNVAKAMDAIAKLKGIGPATASLLLSVHDPDHVIFFSDEAFWWLCCGGRKSPIKYNAKEYQELKIATDQMTKRLQIGATDIEKVAYVVMKDDRPKPIVSPDQPKEKPPSAEKTKVEKDAPPKVPAKRKASSVTTADDRPLRRSTRHKAS